MHSFGYVCDGKYYKQLGSIADHLNKLPRIGSVLIGHCRLATFGNISEFDAQPFYDGAIGVAHNGNIYNYKELTDQYGLGLKSECDSEVLLHLSIQQGIINTLSLVSSSPGAFLFLEKNTVIAFARKLPLWATQTSEGVYLCSLKMNADSVRLMDNYAYVYSVDGLQSSQEIV